MRSGELWLKFEVSVSPLLNFFFPIPRLPHPARNGLIFQLLGVVISVTFHVLVSETQYYCSVVKPLPDSHTIMDHVIVQ